MHAILSHAGKRLAGPLEEGQPLTVAITRGCKVTPVVTHLSRNR